MKTIFLQVFTRTSLIFLFGNKNEKEKGNESFIFFTILANSFLNKKIIQNLYFKNKFSLIIK